MKKKTSVRKTDKAIINRTIPLWFVALLVLISSVPGVYAVLTVQNTTKTSMFGEIYTVTEALTVVTQGVDLIAGTKTAVGDSSASPVTLTAGGATVRTGITKGNYAYAVRVSIATVSANTKYNVTLYREQNEAWVYVDSLYVQQSASPSIGDKATLTWDTGASLSSSTFKVDIEQYT